jgi:hypothetical protein
MVESRFSEHGTRSRKKCVWGLRSEASHGRHNSNNKTQDVGPASCCRRTGGRNGAARGLHLFIGNGGLSPTHGPGNGPAAPGVVGGGKAGGTGGEGFQTNRDGRWVKFLGWVWLGVGAATGTAVGRCAGCAICQGPRQVPATTARPSHTRHPTAPLGPCWL